MKLKLRRLQKPALTGGIKFSLLAVLDLSPAERDAINKYKLGETLLYASEQGRSALSNFRNSEGLGGFALSLGAAYFAKNTAQLITVGMLVNGKQITSKKINDLIVFEEEVCAACENLSRIMSVCKDFGGEEVIDIPDYVFQIE